MLSRGRTVHLFPGTFLGLFAYLVINRGRETDVVERKVPSTVLADTVIGRDLTSDELVRLSFRSRTNSLYVIGKQGRGKTNLLLNLILQDLYHGIGLCVLDPHGDLTTDILGGIPAQREQDVHLFDLQDTEHPCGFDLFAGVDATNLASLKSAEERIVGIFKKVWGSVSWGPRLEDLLGNAVHVLVQNPGTTLADLPPLLTDPRYRQQLLARVTSPVVRDYFVYEYDPLTARGQGAIAGPLLNKVRKFLRDPLLGQIVAQPSATIDFRGAMAHQQIVLIRLNAAWEEATSLLGTAMVLLLFQAALDRQRLPAQQRRPFALYADEFQLFSTPTFGQLLQQARKYAVAMTMAHQVRSQLDAELRDAVKGAVNIITFQTMTDDAGELAREYRSRGTAFLPSALLGWAERHSDTRIRAAAATIRLACLTRSRSATPRTRLRSPIGPSSRLWSGACGTRSRRATPGPRRFRRASGTGRTTSRVSHTASSPRRSRRCATACWPRNGSTRPNWRTCRPVRPRRSWSRRMAACGNAWCASRWPSARSIP